MTKLLILGQMIKINLKYDNSCNYTPKISTLKIKTSNVNKY